MKTPEEKAKEISNITDAIQERCHNNASIMQKKLPSADYQDITNVWIFRELASLQYQILELQEENKELIKRTAKDCTTCKHNRLDHDDYPCNICREASEWVIES